MKITSILFALALSAGCKNQSDHGAAPASGHGKVASCLMESMQSCREYRDGNLAIGTESLQKLCTAAISTAKFTEAACPNDKVIATCAKPDGKDFFYAGYAETAQQIEESCKQSGGTFAAK